MNSRKIKFHCSEVRERKARAKLILVALIAIPVIVFLSGCSHVSQQTSLNKKAVMARNNEALAQAARLMRVSDYGEEAKYGVSLLPVSPEQKAVLEILNLQHDLAGTGKLSEPEREAFVTSLIKDDLKAHRDLYQAHKIDEDMKTAITVTNQKADAAIAQKDSYSIQGATLADTANTVIRYLVGACLLLFALYALHVMYLWGWFGATVAAKIP